MSDALPLFSEPRRISLTKLGIEVARSISGIGKVSVEGEVVKPWVGSNGMIVFTLKDRNAVVSVRCPASRKQRCRVVAGERVEVTGAPEWRSERGELQLVADEVAPVGEGAIAAMLAEVRARLAADGILDRPRRPIPRLPGRIGVVCGTEAAVKADIESVVAARFPGYPVLFSATLVSGAGAAEAIIRSVQSLDAMADVDVIILARGGGDGTQLLPWSDEALCRVLADCSKPVVSAIGHEGDRPLCDEVADLRCGTPSLAAGAVVPDRAALHDELDALAASLHAGLQHRATAAAGRLASIDREVALREGVARARARLDRAGGMLELVHPRARIAHARDRLAGEWRQVEALSPARVLERGYAVVRRADGSVVRRAGEVATGERVDVQVAVGRLAATIESVEETSGD